MDRKILLNLPLPLSKHRKTPKPLQKQRLLFGHEHLLEHAVSMLLFLPQIIINIHVDFPLDLILHAALEGGCACVHFQLEEGILGL